MPIPRIYRRLSTGLRPHRRKIFLTAVFGYIFAFLPIFLLILGAKLPPLIFRSLFGVGVLVFTSSFGMILIIYWFRGDRQRKPDPNRMAFLDRALSTVRFAGEWYASFFLGVIFFIVPLAAFMLIFDL